MTIELMNTGGASLPGGKNGAETLERPSEVSMKIATWQRALAEGEEAERLLVVASDQAESEAIGFVATVKRQAKEAEEVRFETVRPANDYVRRVNAMFKPLADAFDVLERRIKGKILAYQAEKEKRLREAQRILEEEHRKKVAAELARAKRRKEEPAIVAPALSIIPDAQTRVGTIGSATSKKVWTFEVVDVSKLPAQYVQPNPVAINAAVKSGVRSIAGVRIYERPELSVRS